MNELIQLLENILNEDLEQVILSDPRNREEAAKVKVRPVLIKEELLFQETLYKGTQVFHHNYYKADMAERICGMLVGRPGSGQPMSGQPGLGQPMSGQPVLGQPMSGQPVSGQPMSDQPVSGQSMSDQPVLGQPMSDQPMPGQSLPGQSLPGQPMPGQSAQGRPMFGQAQVTSRKQNATVLVSKKGKLTIKVKKVQENTGPRADKSARANTGTPEAKGAQADPKPAAEARDLSALAHNRTRHYILKEGQPVDFLVGLGVQSPDGKVTKAKYDKFRQINRYLEFVEDVLKELPCDRTIRIIDFGCGKSYLTFALYYYLHELQGRDIRVTGLDLKTDVIDHCNALAEKCGYDRLHFEKGDISTYTGADQVDMVVTLHACDTATDYALEKAVKWGAKVIMAVPCCQHEVNRQIHNDNLKPILQYGLIKERMSALITDALRANLLTEQGYDTQILEFIDMEHTPKNLLIRAVKRTAMRPRGKDNSRELMEYLGINPTLAKLLEKQSQTVAGKAGNEEDDH